MNWDTFHLLGQKVNYRRTHFLEHPFDVSPCFTVCVFFADQQPHVLFSLDRLFFHCGHPLLEVCSHHMEFATYVALCCFADWAAQTSVDFSAEHTVTVFHIIRHIMYQMPRTFFWLFHRPSFVSNFILLLLWSFLRPARTCLLVRYTVLSEGIPDKMIHPRKGDAILRSEFTSTEMIRKYSHLTFATYDALYFWGPVASFVLIILLTSTDSSL